MAYSKDSCASAYKTQRSQGADETHRQPQPLQERAARPAAPRPLPPPARPSASRLPSMSRLRACCMLGRAHRQDHPAYGAYELPDLFGEDWLNTYHDMLNQQQVAARRASHAAAGEQARKGAGDAEECGGEEGGEGKEKGVGERRAEDYRFCYVGPRGSWTPLHRDVLHSYSWSTNIIGRLPPSPSSMA
jgi:hypothetical protein